jgi:hypothetical protein
MTVVVFRKNKRSKPQMVVYAPVSKISVDVILDSGKRKPPIPHDWILEDIGVGATFIKIYQKKYKDIKVFYDKTF